MGDWATSQFWLFWLALIIGALLGALACRLIAGEKEPPTMLAAALAAYAARHSLR